MNCDQCEALMINGVFCHETGCPNSRKTWVADREEWVAFVDCRECGFPVEVGTSCDCNEPFEEEEGDVDTVTLPAYWASALVNGDYSGLDDAETARCEAAENKLADEGLRVVSTVDNAEPRFTWSYQLYDPNADCSGGDVLDYIVLKS